MVPVILNRPETLNEPTDENKRNDRNEDLNLAQLDLDPVIRNLLEQFKRRADEAIARADEAEARADEAKARADEAKARADEAKARADKAKARADEASARAAKVERSYCVQIPDLSYQFVDIFTKREIVELQKKCKHTWFQEFMPPSDSCQPITDVTRGGTGKRISVTIFNKPRARQVDNELITTSCAFQAAHCAPFGSCNQHWEHICRFVLGYPVEGTLTSAQSRVIEMVMRGWKDEKGVGCNGFTDWFHNLFVIGDQSQEVEAYPSGLALAVMEFEDLLKSGPTDQIEYVFLTLNPEAAVRMGASGVDVEYVKVEDPRVDVAFKSFKEVLRLLAALAITDPKKIEKDPTYTSKLRAELERRKKIPVPILPEGLKEGHVIIIKLGAGIPFVQRLTKAQNKALHKPQHHHGLEPFTFMTKLSQGWTTHLHSRKVFEFSQDEQNKKKKPCNLFPGCTGVDQHGLPEDDQVLAGHIIAGRWRLPLSSDEMNYARNAFAGNHGCETLRTRIWDWLRTSGQDVDDEPSEEEMDSDSSCELSERSRCSSYEPLAVHTPEAVRALGCGKDHDVSPALELGDRSPPGPGSISDGQQSGSDPGDIPQTPSSHSSNERSLSSSPAGASPGQR